ncbi:MAG: terminase gpA endonuclease subunit [Pseudodesulfovibrio sp.]|uniref:terminase gpA endonuclease subunit n=1 Tax=Pseudodesulfovibrio sp. TaxID=2035812 RepID=UPI003D0FCA60
MSELPLPIDFYPSEKAVFAKPERVSTYDWCRSNLRVVEGPYEGQLWSPEVAPYARHIMDVADRPEVRELYTLGPSQTTKTTIAYAIMLASQVRKAKVQGVGMPDEKNCAKVFDKKLHKYFQKNKRLRSRLASVRDPLQTTEIKLAGGSIVGMWSGSEASQRSISMEEVLADEPDTYQSQQSLASMRERVRTFEKIGTSKFICVGKIMGTENESISWKAAVARGQVWYRYHARCPICGHVHPMDDRNIKALGGEKDPKVIRGRNLARYFCPECKNPWSDTLRDMAVKNGIWRPGRMVEGRWEPSDRIKKPTVVVFQIRSWESTLVSLSTVLADWFEAQGSPALLRNYDNDHKATPYKVVTRETSVTKVRQLITDHPPMVAPSWTWAVTLAADHQLGGLPFVVRAWGKDRSSMLLQAGWVNSLEELEPILDYMWPVQGNQSVVAPVWRAAVDIGGTKRQDEADKGELGISMTDEVKAWLQENFWRGNLFGVKGAARAMNVSVKATTVAAAPNVRRDDQASVGKMVIYMLDPKSLKDIVHYRLNSESRQPMWLHAEMDDNGNPRPGLLNDYIKQMTAERLTLGDKGQEIWDAGRRANHFFDCEYYNAALVDPFWTPAFNMLPEPYLIYPQPVVEQAKSKKKTNSRRSRW